ncbi:MAG TPA: Gfo/Idh/MocA family oxidoreductase [Blastocatellia bacterium]|nr:Gfo/Idh/MocA family oxidoreductase [Blastocatellia bacterium]
MTISFTPTTYEPSILVAGAGYWGINHVRNFHLLGALHTVCDMNGASLSDIAEKFPGVHVERNYRKALADPAIRGVVVATPAETHYPLALAALEAGKDVLVEKPLTLAVDQAEDLIMRACQRGAILMVGHLLEYHPAVLRLRDLIASGALGELRYIYSNRLNLGKVRREENILWSFAPHDIALILRLVGAWPTRVAASGGAYLQPTIADVTVTNMEFPTGIRAHIFVSWLHPHKEQRLVVIGSKRMAVFDDVRAEGKLLVYDQGVEFVNGEPVTRKNEGVAEALEKAEPLRRECVHFLECIKTRRRPLTDGESGLRVLKVLDAAERSLAEGGTPVDVAADLSMETMAIQPFPIHA